MEALDPMEPEIRADDGLVIPPHAAAAHGMMMGEGRLLQEGELLLPALDRRSG
jgi:hypothetical protein